MQNKISDSDFKNFSQRDYSKKITKNLILLLLIVMSVNEFSFAQPDIILNYNDVHIGRNVMLGSKFNVERSAFLVGIKYHFADLIHDNQNNIYKDRFYPANFKQHMGFELGYEYHFKTKAPSTPFVFYDFQYTYSMTRNDMYTYAVDGSYEGYRYVVEHFGPFSAYEQNIGIGIEFDVAKNVYMSGKLGLGICLIDGDEEQLFKPKVDWEVSEIFSVGIGVRLK